MISVADPMLAPARVSSRPPRVQIPPEMPGTGNLASYMASLATEHGPIFSELPRSGPYGGRRVVYLVGPEANRFVLLSHADRFGHEFGWRPVFGGAVGRGLINMDPPEHSHYRPVMAPAFSTQQLDEYSEIMARVITNRTRDWSERARVDLTVETREISFDIAAAALLGLETGPGLDVLRERFYSILHSSTGGRVHRREELDDALMEQIERRPQRTDGHRTVLDLLCAAGDEYGRPLSKERLLGHVDILLVAGYETTTNLSAWTLYYLAEHEQWGAAVDMELAGLDRSTLASAALRRVPTLTNAVREAGRLQPPVMFVPRVALADFKFGGYTVPAGTPVFLAVAAGHRLPSLFANPDEFDPGRFAPPREEGKRHPYALATFGAGPRTCLGVNFALMEIKSIVAHVRRNYRLEPLPDHHVTRMDSIVQCLPAGLPVQVSTVALGTRP